MNWGDTRVSGHLCSGFEWVPTGIHTDHVYCYTDIIMTGKVSTCGTRLGVHKKKQLLYVCLQKEVGSRSHTRDWQDVQVDYQSGREDRTGRGLGPEGREEDRLHHFRGRGRGKRRGPTVAGESSVGHDWIVSWRSFVKEVRNKDNLLLLLKY